MQHITAIRYVFTISVNHNPTTAMMKWDAYDFDLELADCFIPIRHIFRSSSSDRAN